MTEHIIEPLGLPPQIYLVAISCSIRINPRFTRGGSLSYDLLKNQLDSCDVTLVDTYGVISHEQVNTLAHLGHEYKWSKYSPSRKSEMLEAERSKDEVRDILSRVIGSNQNCT